ncbi:NusA-like transcription termination signal-binding factor [Candidatus Woesearchaeota archaeon]|nr:NusA-like transcription termination signal-binding factor [Candidatus Woesearchaeota archaeon]
MKYSNETIQQINLFEQLTHSKVKDLFYNDDYFLFVVQENYGAKAIGKHGENVKLFSKLTKKKLKIVEFSEDKVKFINGLIYPLHADSIEDKGELIEIHADTSIKALIIGRNGKNIKFYNTILQKYFHASIKVQ